MFLDDLVSILVNANVGTFGVNIFTGAKATIPPGDGPYLGITQTGGFAPETTHNDARIGVPSFERPGAQLMTHAKLPASSLAMARAAKSAIFAIGQKSQYVNGVWWRKATIIQEPGDFGLDDESRQCYVFNINAEKSPF